MQYGVVRTSSVTALAVALLGAVTSSAKAQATDSTKAPAYGSTAEPDTTVVRTFGGFVDTYYAWDFNRPHAFVYHDASCSTIRGARWKLATVYAIGTEGRKASDNGTASRWGLTSIAKFYRSSTLALRRTCRVLLGSEPGDRRHGSAGELPNLWWVRSASTSTSRRPSSGGRSCVDTESSSRSGPCTASGHSAGATGFS